MKKLLLLGTVLCVGAAVWAQTPVPTIKLALNDWGSGSNSQGTVKKLFTAPIKTGDKYQIRIAATSDRDIPQFQVVLVDNAAPAYHWTAISDYLVVGKNIKSGAPFDITFEITATGDGKAVAADQSNMLCIQGMGEKPNTPANTRTITLKVTTLTVKKL
jgi:hypothetical protein